MKLRVIIACEESQTICKEFRNLGHEAYSCDLLPCSGGHPEWHFQQDVLPLLKEEWDIVIAHPPCTYLSVSGAQWYYHPDDKHLAINQRRPHPKYPNRAADREDAVNFFMQFVNIDTNCLFVAIENPIGIMSSRWKKPTQIVQPWQFGDEASKSTCLWLRNLNPLQPTNIVGKGEVITMSSGAKMQKWYYDAISNAKTPEERRSLRSKTFPGMAKAMAEQWSKQVIDFKNNLWKLENSILF